MQVKKFWKKIVVTLLTAVLLVIGLSATHADDISTSKYDGALTAVLNNASGASLVEVVIVFKDTAASSQVEALATDYLLLSELPMAGAILTANQVDQVAAMPGVESITLNQELEYFLHESVEMIGVPQIWTQYGQRGGNPNVTVAVIDSGIDGTHPDLLYGQKVLQNVKMTPLGVGVENLPTTDNTSGHGTHVAGTIGGLGVMSGGYYTGVAPDVGLIGLGSGEAISILTAVQSYDWVLTNHETYNIRVINNSWGSSGGELDVRNPISIASYEAYKRGILSVFAAGNDGGYDILNPYSIAPWVLSVAAGDKSFNLAGFSSRGKDGDFYKHPDITAPGVDIYAARCSCVGVTVTSAVNPVNPAWTVHYASLDGTSMATPHVAGVAALLLSQNPQLSPDQLMDLLTTTTTPMPSYALFEVGYGYLNALAAFEASLNISGNLNAFLAGDREQSMELALGVDVDSLVYDTVSYSGYSAVGVTTMPANEYPIPITEEAVIVNVDVSWTPEQEDAFDIEVVDPDGNLVASSGNSVGETESVLFVPQTTGTHTLRVIPFAGINAQYTATINTGYGKMLDNWPPHEDAQFDYIFTVQNLYKTIGVVGVAGGNYFRGGDSGFAVFNFMPTTGSPGGNAADLQAIFTDSQGNIFAAPITERTETPGEYQVSFNLNSSWPLAPGQTTINFVYNGEGAIRPAETVSFYYNHLETTVTTSSNYYPGDTVGFSGTVTAYNTVATSNVQMTPVNASVKVSLVDSGGSVLAETTVTADMNGNYSGTVVSPTSARGVVTVLAEATHEDPTILLGDATQAGTAETTIVFPGNLAPELSLTTAAATDNQGRPMGHMHAEVTDPDGHADVTSIELTIHDADGRLIRRLKQNRFTPLNDAWLLTASTWLKGISPWTITLTAVDSAGNTTTSSSQLTPGN